MLDCFFALNIVCATIIIFFQRKSPATMWAWLLLVYFVPVFGFLLYLLLGQDFYKDKMFRAKEIEGEMKWAAKRQEQYVSQERMYELLIRYNLRSSHSMLTDNNQIQVFNEGKEKFQALLQEISLAEKYVHLEYYIIRNDDTWKAIEALLIKKAAQGVEVRVLFDGMGCRSTPKEAWTKLRENGIHVAEFFPALLGKLQLRINYRNHRKIAVIDGKIGFVGGFNIGDEYRGMNQTYGHWRDLHVRIEGGAVTSLAVRFVLDWNYSAKENLFLQDHLFEIPEYQNSGDTAVQIISSGPDSKNPEIRNNYLRLIHMAKEHIYIQTPYFVPDDNIKDALCIAALSGVDVKIMIPCKPDHMFVYWATQSYIGEMLEAGVKCYRYMDGFLHAKSICIDGQAACLGTANMDIRSFSLNFEVNAVIYGEEVVKELENHFKKDIENSKPIMLKEYAERGMDERFKEQFCRMLSPVL